MFGLLKKYWMQGILIPLVGAVALLWRYEIKKSAQHEVRHEIAQAQWEHSTNRFYEEQKRLLEIQRNFYSESEQQKGGHDDIDQRLLETLQANENWSGFTIPDAIFAELCTAGLVDESQTSQCKTAIQLGKKLQSAQNKRANG
ncbi:hypothetical protein [Piscirickettsia litoralis]|uniref:Uncharacterized protein n=1 Tax=Piscirickettsia litoralis TaxID=1891921 RepID=A0ABX3A1J9_9GAMM|nr:hypothetical protein [Piscirickettsia litoralis]ODN41541.1 hypothetical protein BGC07_15650 [Piscirickettsia litoralis]